MLTVLFRSAYARRRASLAATLTVAAAAFLAPRAATAFCRTTTTPVPASYSPTKGCFADGLPLFWKGACVSYSLNRVASRDVPLAVATTVVDAAFSSWNDVTCSGSQVGIVTSNMGPVECSEVGYNTSAPNQNLVVFRDNQWPYSDPNNTLGLTTVTFNADTGEIYDADMEINATGGNLSTSNTVPSNGFDVLSVVTHEVGHFLGLAHATSSQATMFASYRPGTSQLRTLSSDDTAGLCAIYPTATQRVVGAKLAASGRVAADACDPTPRHGFGSACEENLPPSDSNSGDSGCSSARGPSHRPGTAWLVGLASAVVIALSRRRREARIGSR